MFFRLSLIAKDGGCFGAMYNMKSQIPKMMLFISQIVSVYNSLLIIAMRIDRSDISDNSVRLNVVHDERTWEQANMTIDLTVSEYQIFWMIHFNSDFGHTSFHESHENKV